jgi:hypothetical protein
MLVRLGMGLRRCFWGMSVMSISVATIIIGCKPSRAPMTNTVLEQGINPNGRSSAVLVERYRHSALNANIFYVLVLSKNEDLEKVSNDEESEKRSVLVATRASNAQLQKPLYLARHLRCLRIRSNRHYAEAGPRW